MDPDLEDDAAGEVSLGGLGVEASQIHWGERVSYSGDLEAEHDGREQEEDEHNLGRSENIDLSFAILPATSPAGVLRGFSLPPNLPPKWRLEHGWLTH